MENMYRNYMLMCLGSFMTLMATGVHAADSLTTQQAVDALYDKVVKEYNPYYALQSMITKNPEWAQWIRQQLNILEQAADSDCIKIEKEVSVIITEGNMRDVLVAYEQRFLAPYAAYCHNHGREMYTSPLLMRLTAHLAREGQAYPKAGFRFNAHSYHPQDRYHHLSLRDYRGWFFNERPGKKRVTITAEIVEIDSEQKHYRIDLTFCACKDSSVYQERMKS